MNPNPFSARNVLIVPVIQSPLLCGSERRSSTSSPTLVTLFHPDSPAAQNPPRHDPLVYSTDGPVTTPVLHSASTRRDSHVYSRGRIRRRDLRRALCLPADRCPEGGNRPRIVHLHRRRRCRCGGAGGACRCVGP